MHVRETVIRPFGNSAGVTIPKEMLEKYSIEKGDRFDRACERAWSVDRVMGVASGSGT